MTWVSPSTIDMADIFGGFKVHKSNWAAEIKNPAEISGCTILEHNIQAIGYTSKIACKLSHHMTKCTLTVQDSCLSLELDNGSTEQKKHSTQLPLNIEGYQSLLVQHVSCKCKVRYL